MSDPEPTGEARPRDRKGRVSGYRPPPPGRRCVGHLKTESTARDGALPKGERCPNWGIKGTLPPLCQVHGGMAWSRAERRWLGGKKTGRPRADRYDGALRALPRLAAAAAEVDADPAVQDTVAEIKLARALLVAFVHRVGEGVLAADVLPGVVEHIDRISRLVERHQRQTQGVGLQLSVRDYMSLIDAFLRTTEQFFAAQNPDRWALYLQSIRHLLQSERQRDGLPALPAPVGREDAG